MSIDKNNPAEELPATPDEGSELPDFGNLEAEELIPRHANPHDSGL